MYLTADTALLNCQRQNAVRKGLCSDARRAATSQMAVDGRIALFETIMAPADLALTFGPNLGHDALVLQGQTVAARSSAILGTTAGSVAAPTATAQSSISSAPKVVSLNGLPSQVNGCAWVAPPPRLVEPDPIPTMPLRAPVVVQTPLGPASMPPPTMPGAPTWLNLCWAIRNGAADVSQFAPDELFQLEYKCAQLGYPGSCPPPPNTQAYLDSMRRNKTPFPHIQITTDLLNSIPQAPPLTGVACPENYKMGGLSGIAPMWADALVMNQSDTSVSPTSMSGWGWLALALAAGGAVALSRRGR
jgi:hypothetical protein